MQTVKDLYQTVRLTFPDISQRADELHVNQWGTLDVDLSYSWFESLANALNQEMSKERPYENHKALFDFMDQALSNASVEIYQCIDVAFVENLFWQVPSKKCASYWNSIPQALRRLYIDFHHREP